MEEIFINEAARRRRERISKRSCRNSFNCISSRQLKQMVIVVIAVFIFLATVIFVVKSVNASEKSASRVKGYVSVEILSGDTVWSIADKYISPEYSNVSELVNEIIKTNHLSEGRIIAGNYLVVPVYRDAVHE